MLGSSAKANVLEFKIVLCNDICHHMEDKLGVTGVRGTGEAGVDFLSFLVAV